MIQHSNWIRPSEADGCHVPVFCRKFRCDAAIRSAYLEVTAVGVYEAMLNGKRVGHFILAPGWTEYDHRLQVQRYDIRNQIDENNELRITVAGGWFRRKNPEWANYPSATENLPAMLIAEIHICYTDGREMCILTDAQWTIAHSSILHSNLFDGEYVDARTEETEYEHAQVCDFSKNILIPQQGCEIIEQETIFPCREFITPNGERVVDFGQNLTGYMVFETDAHAGERLCLSTAEVLDAQGNFYTENYRTARSRLEYTCCEGYQAYKPRLTFYGFRYLRIDEAPVGFKVENLRAIEVHSDIARTGWLESGDPMLNQLFRNVIWGQKDNFLDVPTDCPQRDERLGWTGDAQVFIRAACYNYDVRRFFKKWLADMRCAQQENGAIPDVVPNVLSPRRVSSAWGDAVAICPWQLYSTYGDISFLEDQYESMRKWIQYITNTTQSPDLWTGADHYGDWLGLDAAPGSYTGSSDKNLIASAFYAHSTQLTLEAGRILGRDVTDLEELYQRIVAAFDRTYGNRLKTQTEKVLALEFNLAKEPQKIADALAQQIKDNGTALQTGFVGTPYLLRVLSRHGYVELAYSLLLRKEYPSWLYSVGKGATTIWEHWDGIREDGSFWSADMNSFNHYAYGAVVDWVYEYACGIQPAIPGFGRAVIAPHPDDRVQSMSARIDTVNGTIESRWFHTEGRIRYEIRIDMPATVCINGTVYNLEKGSYVF